MDNNTAMASIGARLKEARDRKSLTIDQVQKQTHIHSTVLKALEEGRCDEILTATYVKSFLKKYALYLGLDHKKFLEEYDAVNKAPGRREARSAGAPAPEAGAEPEVSALLPVLKVIAVSASVMILLILLGGRITSKFRKPARTRTAAAAKAVPVRPAADSKKASARIDRPKVSIPKNVPLKLLLKVNQNVWVELKADRNLLFSRVLTKGTAEEFTADKVINVYTAKAEAIELVLNGRNLGSFGRGPVANIEITRDGARIK